LNLNAITEWLGIKAVPAYGRENLHNPPRGHSHCCSEICWIQSLHFKHLI